jgi:HD-like signal output (HDOD) protein
MLNPDDFKQSIQAIDALGTTPAVLIKVVKLAKDPNTDIETLCDLLRNDGPMSAEIIRISNSSYYAPGTIHGNLSSAVNQIGLREMIHVVNLSLARKLFARDLPSYGISAYDYWSASVASALVMEALAKHSGRDCEDAYTIGILHAIGRILIDRVIEEKGFSIYWDGSVSLVDWERNAVGFDCAQAGAMLLQHWQFPATTCEVINRQLDPAPTTDPESILGSLQFTLRLLALTGLDFKNKDGEIPAADPYLAAAGLAPASVTELVSGCRENFQRILQSVDWD